MTARYLGRPVLTAFSFAVPTPAPTPRVLVAFEPCQVCGASGYVADDVLPDGRAKHLCESCGGDGGRHTFADESEGER